MPLGEKIRVLIIDDHALLRAGLANLLAVERDLAVVGEADGGESGIRLWPQLRPHVGIVQSSMNGLDGIETTRRIRRIQSDAKIIMLTSAESATDADLALQAGASAYLTKHTPHRQIGDVIRQVHHGATAIRNGVRRPAGPAATDLLSGRELQVLNYLRHGTSNAEIGRRMGIAERTVKAHVTSILIKLNAPDRSGAVGRGFDLGLLKIAPELCPPGRT
jgi:DNA-binding NarL/FixJ family response regulator